MNKKEHKLIDKMNKNKHKGNIKQCTYCQKMDNLKQKCQNKDKEMMKINKGAIGEKKEEMQTMEPIQERSLTRKSIGLWISGPKTIIY